MPALTSDGPHSMSCPDALNILFALATRAVRGWRQKQEVREVCHRARQPLIDVRNLAPCIWNYIIYGNGKKNYSDLVVGRFIPPGYL